MSKVLAALLALAAFISAIANAPGITPGHSKHSAIHSRVAASPASSSDRLAVNSLPADDLDPAAWLDLFTQDAQAQLLAWQHSWKDAEILPASYYPPGFFGYGRSRWEPRGVLLADEPTFGAPAYRPDSTLGNFAARSPVIYGGAAGGGGKAKPARNSNDNPDTASPPNTGGSPGDDTLANDGPANDEPDISTDDPPTEPDDPMTSPPDEDDRSQDPPGDNPPVQVPEPASMSLLALGLAGLSMFGRRRARFPASE